MGIPVYMFTGFLESGKTQFIKDTLLDPGLTENEIKKGCTILQEVLVDL